MGGKHKEEVSGLVKNTGVVFHSRTADAPDKAVLSKRAQDAQVVGQTLCVGTMANLKISSSDISILSLDIIFVFNS